MNWKELIPWDIKIKSLYWVQKEKEINKDLEDIFYLIDQDAYADARLLKDYFFDKWTLISHNAPEWFQLDYIPEFSRAEAMLNFLTD